MKPCCLESIKKYISKHRDVATCDGCGALLLAYGNERDLEAMKQVLGAQGVPYEVEVCGKLTVIGKPPATACP